MSHHQPSQTIQQTNNSNTIIAQCTARGPGALALLRLVGPQARAIAHRLTRLASRTSVLEVPTHTVHYGALVDQDNTVIDQVLLIIMDAPRTFTGEDTVEITCHNNQILIERIIAHALACGARIAQPGEFTQRAFLNNKIDLLQAEAINELINAQTADALKHSLAQLNGSLSAWVTQTHAQLVHALALSEASFEFLDEESMTFSSEIKTIIGHILNSVTVFKRSFDQQQQLRHGIRVVLLGSVNAGKSSLFNALLQRNRAIVSDIPGTTRDSLEAPMSYNGTTWTLVDTAGLRDTDNIIEQEGIKRSLQEAQAADIILLVIDASKIPTAAETQLYVDILTHYGAQTIVVFNKSDLPLAMPVLPHHTRVHISTKTRTHIDALERQIALIKERRYNTEQSPFLLNQRHYNLLLNLEQSLTVIIGLMNDPIDYAILSYELKEAAAQLAQLSGKTISEDAMDAVFKEFCVGK